MAMRAPIASSSRLVSRACPLCISAGRAASTSADPVDLYLAKVASGSIQKDETQLRAAFELRKVQRTLLDYRPPAALVHLLDSMRSTGSDLASKRTLDDPPGWLVASEYGDIAAMSEKERKKALVRVLSGEEELLRLQTPTGFLLTGPPGTGKSLLMDIFFDSIPTPHKTRRHYHHFLLSLYHQVFLAMNKTAADLDAEEAAAQSNPQSGGYPWSRREEARAQAITRGWRSVFAGGRSLQDPTLSRDYVLALVARDMIINDGWLLAFDEIQLVDVAGASILRRVLEHFWRLGGVVVGTSNRLPDDLYQKGLQREQFLTFLAILQARCPVIELRADQDYRRLKHSANSQLTQPAKAWYLTADRDAFEMAAARVLGPIAKPDTLTVYARTLSVPLASEGAARFSFSDLCDKALGPADYISIASRYHTIIIDNVPQLPLVRKNEARRFITLIDSLYETKTRLLCLAAAKPDELFFPDGASAKPAASLPVEDDEAFMGAKGGGPHPLSALRRREEEESQLDTRNEDVLESEMLTDVLRDLEAPYRPNISSYVEESSSKRPVSTLVEAEVLKRPSQIDTIPAFRNLSIFSGEDERFAYARAVSRLFEMESSEYVFGAKHQPLAESLRSWERPVPQPIPVDLPADYAAPVKESAPQRRGIKYDPLDEGIDPAALDPPKIKPEHAWGMAAWGRRAGLWGRGAEAYEGKEKK